MVCVVGRMRDLILQLSKSSIYSTKPSQQQLSRYERGTNKINIAHLVKIAVALKTPISWFFIDCMEDLNVSDIPINYATGLDVELKQRLEQVWNKLDNTKRKSLIMFLDEFIK
ncbi:helix-turn-helix domain-containing protein [Citrobacter portucalensis]|uniref:helix-turn-helix domain-containing protein n=1 Tax=Citrobacter portucalensis TaxID=1639133 RepID=UPI00397E349B